jgi:hypothetical protein
MEPCREERRRLLLPAMPIVVSIVIRMGIDMHRRAPKTGDPDAARPITGRPNITRPRARRGCHHDRRRDNKRGRYHYDGCGRGHRDHGDGNRRKRETDRKTEADSRMSRQTYRANQGGSEKQFRFHNIQFFIVFSKALTAFIGLYGAGGGILQKKLAWEADTAVEAGSQFAENAPKQGGNYGE